MFGPLGKSLKIAARRTTMATVCLVASSSLWGCVNQQEYDTLFSANRALEDRNVALHQEIGENESTIALQRDRIRAGDETISELQDRNGQLNDQTVQLRERYRQLSERLNSASLAMVDPATDRALRDLAQQFPNLVTYDASRGMLRLASDLTFASGSTQIADAARSGLGQLAKILSSNASDYDIVVVGHTDNVAISKASTKRLHPTNMYLAVHRAIAVRDALKSFGVSANRMEVAGWGPYRPVTPNPTSGKKGVAANRRVEIFLTTSTIKDAAPMTAPAGNQSKPAPKRTGADPLK